MKLFVSVVALLAVAGCATQNSNYAGRGLASSDLKKNIDAYAEEFPECGLGTLGDGLNPNTLNRKCILGAIAHELKLTSDAGIDTPTLAIHVETFINLENHYAGSVGGSVRTSPVAYSNYKNLRAIVKAYRENELDAKALRLQTTNAITQKITAENAAVVSRDIDASVAANNNEQNRIKIQQIILQKKSEHSNYNSVKRFLELRQEFRKAELKDINAQGRKLTELSEKVEATFAELTRRYDGTDQILNAILSNLSQTARTMAAIDNRVQRGLDQYEETCAASNRSVKKAFAGEVRACTSAIEVLKGEVQTIDNLISVTGEEIKKINDIIKEKSAELAAAGTPQLAITQKAADNTKDSVLSFYTAQLSVLEANKAELRETRVSVNELIVLVEGQIAEFKSNEKAFMAKQEAEMAQRVAVLQVVRHTYKVRTEALMSLYQDVEADKSATPEAGLLRLTTAREMLKSRQEFLKSEAGRINNIIAETKGYLDGFYKQKLAKLESDLKDLDRELRATYRG